MSKFTSLWYNLSKKKYLAFYAVLSLAIMLPLFKPGYLLLMDNIGNLNGPIDIQYSFFGHSFSPALPFNLVAWPFNQVVPQWVTQKILWFLALFIAGVGAHRLCPTQSKVGKFFAGILYMMNPFLYARFLAGQEFVVLGYAFIPFALYYFIASLENRERGNLLLAAIFPTIIACFSTHMFSLTLFAFSIILVAKAVAKRQDRKYLASILKRVSLLSAIILLLNVYWLVPLLASEFSALAVIGEEDMFYFAPQANTGFGPGFSILSMHGFWLGGYLYTKDIMPSWWLWLVTTPILFLSIYGLITEFANRKYGIYVKAVAIVGIITFVLALGVSSSVTKPLFAFLWKHLFFFSAFRDSQKFVALLVLAYSFLGGLGVSEFVQGIRAWTKSIKVGVTLAVVTGILILIIPLSNCFTIFNGFWDQIKPVDYPQDWYEVNDYLNEDPGDFNVLFLPWHQFMDFDWLPGQVKRLGNPASHLFDKPVISGDNLEMVETYTQSTNPMSKYVEFLFGLPERRERNITNLGELLSLADVKYVLLTKEIDWSWYHEFLLRQTDLQLVKDTQHFFVFRNNHTTRRIYQVSNIAYIKDWDELFERSKQEDLLDYLYLIGDGEDIDGGESGKPLINQRKSAVKYAVEKSSHKYVIFIPEQQMDFEYWEYNGQQQIENLGFMPAFESSPDGGEVVYTRFYHVYLPGYVISGLALGFTVYLYFRRSSRKADR